jgi:hypothetical protein
MDAPEGRSKALNEHMSSGFAPRPDIVPACRHVRFVQLRTYAVQQNASLFDHLVRELLDRQRHLKAKRLGGLQIDDKFEFG